MDFTGSGKPMTQTGFDAAQNQLTVDAASLWAILSIETHGMGFLADRRPKILFERHIFHRRTQGRFDAAAPDLSAPSAGGYSGGAAEYARLIRATALDTRAALESASWGLGQIMGFHAPGLGYASVEDMVARFRDGEDAQLDGMRRFIAANVALHNALRDRKWSQVAFFYNGAAYAKNQYDQKLQRFYALYSQHEMPDLSVRAAQVRLTYLGYDPHGIDGAIGPGTRAALLAFQAAGHLAPTANLDQVTQQTLERAAGV
jgi:hypothetical protein